ncbi:hypothetical protein SUSAZ_05555 [Sulfolobus acidocaldarius SUSAZ]|nr:hypothetical protein SUSAZ_05555 [Sulfolobus acidocaldarius SUSAZ]
MLSELKTYISKPVLVVRENDSLLRATREMRNHNIGALVVVNANEEVVGIITERDVVKAFADGNFDATVGDYMSREVKGVKIGTDIYTALKTMVDNGFRHLPVVEGDKVHGIVSIRDLVKALVDLDNLSNMRIEASDLNSCPVCGLEIDEFGYCGCGTGSD